MVLTFTTDLAANRNVDLCTKVVGVVCKFQTEQEKN